MQKNLLSTLLALLFLSPSWAGGFLTNTNQNVSFLRNPARGASLGIDAAYTNPAGLALIDMNGLFLSINNQSAFQTRTITANFAPLAGYGGNPEKKFEGKAQALVIPNIQAAYKKDKWAFSLNAGIVGGGGTLEFAKGLPSFEAPVSMIPLMINQQLGSNAFNGYSLESTLKGSSIIYGAQVGASYSFAKNFSAYLGLRLSYINNGYDGYLKNIMMHRADGAKIPISTLMPSIGDMNLDLSQTGAGIAPIIGVDYRWNKLNVGVKYEFKTSVNLTNKTEANTTGMQQFDDNVKTPSDIPALLTIGAQYDILPQLTVSLSHHYFFDSSAKMANDKQKLINGGINEYLGGVEYRINDKLLVSCGAQITRTGATDDYQTDLSFSLNSVSFGFGGAYNITKNIRVNLAYFLTNYDDWTKNSSNYANTGIAGTDVFARTNQTFGIGVDLTF